VPSDGEKPFEIALNVPGETSATAFGLTVQIELAPGIAPPRSAVLRPWKPGDRVRLQYSSGDRKVKEVLERMKVTGSERAHWPVIALESRIVWMQGVKVEPVSGIAIEVVDSGAAAELNA
jgi:tRNA(Ile)-lysidine synthase